MIKKLRFLVLDEFGDIMTRQLFYSRRAANDWVRSQGWKIKYYKIIEMYTPSKN